MRNRTIKLDTWTQSGGLVEVDGSNAGIEQTRRRLIRAWNERSGPELKGESSTITTNQKSNLLGECSVSRMYEFATL